MTTETRKGIISFSISDRGALYAAYMQFLKNGGVFVPTSRQYELGDTVFMLLKLMDETVPIAVEGQVVWITPAGAQGNKNTGVGVQFADSAGTEPRTRIENHLGATLSSDRQTHTM